MRNGAKSAWKKLGKLNPPKSSNRRSMSFEKRRIIRNGLPISGVFSATSIFPVFLSSFMVFSFHTFECRFNLEIGIDANVILDLHHTRSVADRAEHRPLFLPRMNSSPENDRTVMDLDSQTFSLAVSASLQCVLNLLTQLFLINCLFTNRDLVAHANDPGESPEHFFSVGALAPVIYFPFERHPAIGNC